MKVLGIFAHPDDEIIFGWPIFQDKSIDRYLIVCSNDSSKYGQIKSKALIESCKIQGIKLVRNISLDCGFFRLERKMVGSVIDRFLDKFYKTISKAIETIHPDYLFTHTPWGDNGNSDHKFVSDLVINKFVNYPVLITSICEQNRAWLSYPKVPRIYKNLISSEVFKKVKLDSAFYHTSRKVYDKYNVWTYSQNLPKVQETKLIELK